MCRKTSKLEAKEFGSVPPVLPLTSATSPAKPWRHKNNPLMRRAHFSLNHANVSRRVGLSHSSHAPRLMPKLASLSFWWLSRDSCFVSLLWRDSLVRNDKLGGVLSRR
jgi:hypothetical protein